MRSAMLEGSSCRQAVERSAGKGRRQRMRGMLARSTESGAIQRGSRQARTAATCNSLMFCNSPTHRPIEHTKKTQLTTTQPSPAQP